jgi:hypothetical protein
MIWRAYRFVVLQVHRTDLSRYNGSDGTTAGITPLTHAPVWNGETVHLYNFHTYIRALVRAQRAGGGKSTRPKAVNAVIR